MTPVRSWTLSTTLIQVLPEGSISWGFINSERDSPYQEIEMVNVLQLARIPIYPPENGRSVRVWETAKKFSEWGDVTLCTPLIKKHQPETDRISLIETSNPLLKRKLTGVYGWNAAQLFPTVSPYDWIQSQFTTRAIAKLDEEFDLVVSESPQCTQASARIAERDGAPLLLNKHNAYYAITEQFLSSTLLPELFQRRLVRSVRNHEQYWIKQADAVVFQSDVDREAFEVPSTTRTRTIPNGTSVESIRCGGNPTKLADNLAIDPGRPICVFIGSYDYSPNREAARTILDEIAPALPEADFLLVGRNPPPDDQTNVFSLGFVDDLPGVLALADIALCPLWGGSGTKLKIMDYLAAGLPIITTPEGASGIDLEDEETALICQSTNGFIKSISRILDSPQLANQMSQNAAKLGDKYDWDNQLRGYDELLDSLLS